MGPNGNICQTDTFDACKKSTKRLLEELSRQRVAQTFITLHIGSGTFQPVRVKNISKHDMHPERMYINADTVNKILQTKRKGGRVVAVGTSVARALETVALKGELNAFEGETKLFIYPPFQFNIVDLLITNFHLPESSLLMLVAAFTGVEKIMFAYQYAISKRLRFYSYGDAMLVEKQ